MTIPLFSSPPSDAVAPRPAAEPGGAVAGEAAQVLDGSARAGHPEAATEHTAASKLDELITVTARLRAPGGCPWDAEQTHSSLVRYLIEESHELVDAIESGSREDLLEELGDVLYQVIFHADLAAHTAGESFDIQDVAAHMTAKMVGRHPHVFGDATAESAADVVGMWDDLKAVEKPGRTSVLDGIPLGMPSLLLADKLLGKAQKVGVLDAAAPPAIAFASEDELGPLLLAIALSAKTQGFDAERALRNALRDLSGEIREAEAASASASVPAPDAHPTGLAADTFDAGVIALPAAD
ncbi:MazG family protein [Subtercola sp. RTI3]|uniref:MazG family protein n=1 Tax=Subtercola sp. RTI3 TaxID=3048639 RepID=UPI002B23BD9A|nr:MazG family protein [Subtercola sp. RTI3]MEA9987004.1 MazG family protein [Subtercola sp. RTI3]